ncbi:MULTISPECIES: phenylalanine 4-monooxygenase [unclassified Brevundimonas]|uniref:phenylalanine 4-monooxygenase n=1 Tax=unclassified Brevundimonas TaxID=2622653 RepID=UPI000CFD13CF|nr:MULTISPECIES: phenylalanine 4-monooxygenase [unclassified Brevundimonas]PRA24020.1 phenylalanine 4-monooxygenase [Brevundimonas sp. MYb27]PQZ82868.1 phenylalanine 4-monooxygenase [Brevundimonas sp. MYb31]PRB16735.1 phenylalanine 4-monooxygenase [Brevundimonas sp. MYb52]PRB34727.1 phenylalanine 4-monooxygenase [Brevundimonas sp. MYb46]PRB54705.1 phenylalanine 4-monooxygenase [Brevundimonas sp. MYb33]
MSDFEHVFEAPPEGTAADWTIPQNWDAYTEVEHETWNTLYARQMKILPGRACEAYMRGLDALDLNMGGIPDFEVMNPKLQALTGWTVVCVPGLVPDEVFFDHLANRRFVSGQFIRKPDQLDYLQEPDIFHDVFGHVPMLTDPDFAAYMEAYGKGGQRAQSLGMLKNLARLYWYTVEFGLMKEAEGLRIYGAGIVSSATESVFSLEDASPNRLGFDLERVMKTLYRIDDFQQVYFVIDSIEELKAVTLKDFGPLYERLKGAEDLPIEAVLPSDQVFTRGTQAYAHNGGRFAA